MALSLAWGIDDSVWINGNEYNLNLEFSSVLRWYEVFQDPLEGESFKIISALMVIGNLEEDEISQLSDEEIEKLFIEIVKRVFGEQDKTVETDLKGNPLNQGSVQPTVRYYDYIEDSEYIYASFRQDYGINLLEERGTLHWDEFNALLIGLSEKTKFRDVLKTRMMKIPDSCTPEERKEILEAKRAVALKTNREATEFEAMDLLQKREWYEKNKGRCNG